MRNALGRRDRGDAIIDDRDMPPADRARNAGFWNVLSASMRESLLLADREGTVLWANPAAERTLGQGPLSLIGLCLGSLLHPADADQALDTFAKVAAHQIGRAHV